MALFPALDWLANVWAGYDRQVAFLSLTASVLALGTTIAIAIIVAKSSRRSSEQSHALAKEVAELTRQSRVESLRQQLRVTDDAAHAQMLIARGRELTEGQLAERVDLEAVAAANVVVPLPRSIADLPKQLGNEELARIFKSALDSLSSRHDAGLLNNTDATRTAVELSVLSERFEVSAQPVAEMIGRHLGQGFTSSHELITAIFGEDFTPARATMLRQLPAYLKLLNAGRSVSITTVVNVMAGVSEAIVSAESEMRDLPGLANDLARAYRWVIPAQSRRMAEAEWDLGMTVEPADALAEAITAAILCERAGSGHLRYGLTGAIATALDRLVDEGRHVLEPQRNLLTEAVETLIEAQDEVNVTRRLRRSLKSFGQSE